MKKTIVLLWCVLLSSLLSTQVATAKVANEDYACNFTAPTNLHLTQIGDSWFSIAWNQVPSATTYRVQTFDHNNQLVNTQYLSTTAATVNNLNISGNPYMVIVCAVCTDGSLGTPAILGPLNIITIDLVVQNSGNNYSGSSMIISQSIGNVNPNQLSFFPKNGVTTVWCEIYSTIGNDLFRFKIWKDNGTLGYWNVGGIPSSAYANSIPDVYLYGYSADNPTNLYPPQLLTSLFKAYNITGSGNLLDANIGISSNVNNNQESQVMITVNFLKPDQSSLYDVRLVIPGSGAPPSELDGTTATLTPSTGMAWVAYLTNPVTEVVNVHFRENLENQVIATLYSANGTRLRSMVFDDPQQDIELPVADLPKGLYLIRLESGNTAGTYKVIKQ